MNTSTVWQNIKASALQGALAQNERFEVSPGVEVVTNSEMLSTLIGVWSGTDYLYDEGDDEYQEVEYQLFDDAKGAVYKYWVSTDNGINEGYDSLLEIIKENDF